jgi:hypothetical protein
MCCAGTQTIIGCQQQTFPTDPSTRLFRTSSSSEMVAMIQGGGKLYSITKHTATQTTLPRGPTKTWRHGTNRFPKGRTPVSVQIFPVFC